MEARCIAIHENAQEQFECGQARIGTRDAVICELQQRRLCVCLDQHASLALLFGLPGALLATLLVALGMLLAGYACLAREGRQPAWHHHVGRPLLASLDMVAVCLVLVRWHVLAALAGGVLSYFAALAALGGFPHAELKAVFGKHLRRHPAA